MKVGNGRGYCVGVPGNPYTSDVSQSTSGLVDFFLESYDALFIFFTTNVVATKNQCKRICKSLGGPGFQGYTFFENTGGQKRKKADCACHYDDGHAPDCPSSMDIDGREFDCAKSEAGAASGPISGTIRRPPGAVGEFGSARCYIAVDSYGGKSGKAKGEYYPSSRSGLDV